MKKLFLCAAAVLAAVAVGGCWGRNPISAAAENKSIDVNLIGGQSNAVGYGYDDLAANGYTDARYSDGFENVLFYGNYETEKTCPADFVPVRKGLGKNWNNGTSGSGAELGVASMLGDTQGVHAVIKCAWGATFLAPDASASVSLSQGTWTPPSYRESHGLSGNMIGNMYARFLSTVRLGLEKLTAKGYAPVVKGMWWMQGEAEVTNSANANAYAELLSDLIDDLRADLTRISGSDLSGMPFVLGKIYRNPDPQYTQFAYIDTVRAAQQKVADEKFNVFPVDCTGLKQQDGWHFRASAQAWLGEQFVSAVLRGEGKRQVSFDGSNVSATGLGVKETGASVRVSFSPDRGYKLVRVFMREGEGEAREVALENGGYTFTMPDANVFFTAETEKLPLYRLTSYSVNDTAMGSVFPSAEAKNGWYEGESATLAVSPGAGFAIKSASINGESATYASAEKGVYYYRLPAGADVEFYVEFEAVLPQESSGSASETEGESASGGCSGFAAASWLLPVAFVSWLIVRKQKE